MPIKIKKKKDKKQKQKQKQIVNQRVVVNLADTKPRRRRVARRRPQVNIPQSVIQYVPIQSGSSVPNIVKYYNNIMTPQKDIQAVRQQQQEDYTNAISQSAKEEDMRETKQAEAGIINPLVAEQDDMDVMNRAIIQQAEDYNKKARRGRPAGSKNKSKEVKEQERLKKQAKRDARERRREDLFRQQSGYITENPQTDVADY